MKNSLVEVVVHPVNIVRIHHCHRFRWNKTPLFADCDSLVLFGNTAVRRNTSPVSCLHLLLIPSPRLDLNGVTHDSMPYGYVLDVPVLISNICYCMLQSVRKTLLIGFEIGPPSIELVFAMGILLYLVKAQDSLHLL